MPQAFDETAKRRFLIQIERGQMPRTAAENMSFTWATVRKHLREDPAFAEGYADAAARVDEMVEGALLDTILEDRNVTSIKFWLSNRKADVWKEMTKQAVGGGGTTINIGLVTTGNLRDVLTDPDSREAALLFLKDVPAIEATATEVG